MTSQFVLSNYWSNGDYISSSGAYCSIRGTTYFAFNQASLPNVSTSSGVKQWIATQYAAGTPVTVWYPFVTPVEEDWTETTYGENVYIPQNQ